MLDTAKNIIEMKYGWMRRRLGDVEMELCLDSALDNFNRNIERSLQKGTRPNIKLIWLTLLSGFLKNTNKMRNKYSSTAFVNNEGIATVMNNDDVEAIMSMEDNYDDNCPYTIMCNNENNIETQLISALDKLKNERFGNDFILYHTGKKEVGDIASENSITKQYVYKIFSEYKKKYGTAC